MRNILPPPTHHHPCGTSRDRRRDGMTRWRIRPPATVAASMMLLVISATATAQIPEERGFAIAREAAQRDSGYHDLTAELTVVLRNRDGEERSAERSESRPLTTATGMPRRRQARRRLGQISVSSEIKRAGDRRFKVLSTL